MVNSARLVATVALALLGGATNVVAQPSQGPMPVGVGVPVPPGPPPATSQRRAVLEEQIMRAFVQRAAQELRLEAGARDRLWQFMERGEAQRRALAREGADLAAQLQRALRNPATPDREFERILAAMDEVRERELALWRSEHQALAEFMTPRQRAQYVTIRNRFNQAVIQVRGGGRRGP